MYRWFQRAAVCYVFLKDVPDDCGQLRDKSYDTDDADVDSKIQALVRTIRWFTRGWTLQELIAPRKLCFYSIDWTLLGSLEDFKFLVSDITGIDTPSSCYMQSNCRILQ